VDTAGLSIEGMADIALRFVDVLELSQPPDVIGWSMGGFISLTMAAKHPSKIGKVVMIGSRASGPDLEVGSIDLNPNHFDNLENLKLHIMEGLFTHGLDDPGLCMLLGSLASSPYFRSNAAPREVIELQYQAIANYFCDATANYDLLPLIRNSILFISGAQDKIIPMSSTVATMARVPGAWLNTIAEGGHAFPHQYPFEFTRLVFDFLDIAEPLSQDAAEAVSSSGVRYTCDDSPDKMSCGNKVIVGPPVTRGWASS